MNKILCSTGALLGRPNNRDYKLLKEFEGKLECDGFEFMIYSSWYPEIENLISVVKSFNLNIPVIHCQKSLGEALCGMKVSFDNEKNCFNEYVYTEEEDKEVFNKGIDEFKTNVRVAQEFGAQKMVLHLWNGIASDKNLSKNIERFGVLNDIAVKAGLELLVENVVCNTHDPLSDLSEVHKSYENCNFVYDTKMAEFHEQTMKVFETEYEWIVKDGHVKHLHVNDYNGGYMDWSNLNVLPIGKGHVDFDTFFASLSQYGYTGDYTVEATALAKNGEVDFNMLNNCFGKLRELTSKYMRK